MESFCHICLLLVIPKSVFCLYGNFIQGGEVISDSCIRFVVCWSVSHALNQVVDTLEMNITGLKTLFFPDLKNLEKQSGDCGTPKSITGRRRHRPLSRYQLPVSSSNRVLVFDYPNFFEFSLREKGEGKFCEIHFVF